MKKYSGHGPLSFVGRACQEPLDESCVQAGRTSLQLPENLAIETWSDIGTHLLSISDSSTWWIGDWLVFGQERYADRYRHAMTETSLNYQTLRNYAWVARRFDLSRRRDELTFQHHAEVASLPNDVQDHWFDLAVKLGWSRNELRRQMRHSEATDDDRDAVSEVQVHLRLSKDRVDRWEHAARQDNRDLADWMANVLDGATIAVS